MPKKSPSARSGGQGKNAKKRSAALQRPISIPDRKTSEGQATDAPAALDESTMSGVAGVSASDTPTPSTAGRALPAATRSAPTSPTAPISPARAAAAQRSARQRGGTSSLVDPQQYRYVYKDLRLIAILAVCMFVAIIVLSFFLH